MDSLGTICFLGIRVGQFSSCHYHFLTIGELSDLDDLAPNSGNRQTPRSSGLLLIPLLQPLYDSALGGPKCLAVKVTKLSQVTGSLRVR